MLQTIRNYIANLPEKDFGTFYQEYVLHIQDDIIEANARALENKYMFSSDTNQILSGINTLTEELNELWKHR